MDPQKAQDNRSNQCNPNHALTGPGRQGAYQGSQEKANRDNHGNQLNPNNELFSGMDSQQTNTLDNYANQCNPNHAPTGPGRQGAYQGSQEKANRDNHGNQLNPNNERFVQNK